MRDSDSDAEHTDYVECTECGHPIEVHQMVGCTDQGCTCAITWTKGEIIRFRRLNGLAGRSAKWGLH